MRKMLIIGGSYQALNPDDFLIIRSRPLQRLVRAQVEQVASHAARVLTVVVARRPHLENLGHYQFTLMEAHVPVPS
jgi:hypothetical protein